MIHFLHKDYDRTGRRTHDQSVILLMWIFIGFASSLAEPQWALQESSLSAIAPIRACSLVWDAL